MKLNHWRQHEPILMAFESAWHKDRAPLLKTFLNGATVEDQTSLLAELVMIDFEHRWRRGTVVNVDSYFDDFPELSDDRGLRDELLFHEFCLRKSAGKSPTDTELETRFAGDSAVVELCDQIGTESDVSLESLLQPGTLVGPYKIIGCIGRGAFATVYSAVDTHLQRNVALKFLTAGDIRSAARMRLRREAQAVATLKHANIVPVFGAGNYRGHDYVVTRLVEGVTLDQWMKDRSLSSRKATELVVQLCSALDHAHDAGIVHRDVKPANVMIEDDVPLLLDFGLAHLVDTSQHLTHEGDLVGTPAFMPPEQADGRGWQADPRSDIYSLGAMLYQMVFRRLPFEGTTSEIISQIIGREPSIPRDAPSMISRDLQTIILKCLQKEPSHRYRTANELRADLQCYLDGKPIVARPVGLGGRMVKWARRRPVVALLMAGIITLLVFGGGMVTQLRDVTADRDRAQKAETETQFLLAASAADAGRLALQRGEVHAAVNHFELALDRGCQDRVEVLLSLVRANFILRNPGESKKLLALAVAEPLAGDHQGALTMWQAELALEEHADSGVGEQLFERAHQMKLAPADQKYVSGILAKSSLLAVDNFRVATDLDPYHYRSRRMLIFMLLSLAKLDETELQIRIARQLYPDDLDFLLFDSLTQVAQGKIEAAEDLLQESSLDDGSRKNWLRFCRRLFDISQDGFHEAMIGEPSIKWLDGLSRTFQTDFLPLIQDRNWRFPPRIGRHFAVFAERLPDLLTGGIQPSTDALQQLVAIHPEGSLFLALGSLRLVEVSATGIGRENEIVLLEKARDEFSDSLKHQSFFKQSQQPAWLALFTTSVTLAGIHHHDVEANKKRCAEASRHIDHQSVRSFNQARALFIAAITNSDLDEADRWMERWLQFPPHDDRQRVDVMWHEAILFKRHKNWLAVRDNCQRILNIVSDHSLALGLFDTATKKIEKILESR